MIRSICILSVLLSAGALVAQKDSLQLVNRALLEQYLRSEGDPVAHIEELLFSAKEAYLSHQTQDALYLMYVALELAERCPPSETTFELNLLMALFLNKINSQYALDYFNHAILITTQTGITPYRQFDMLTNKAGVHIRLMQYDSARYCYHLADRQAKQCNLVTQSSSKNNVGVFFLDLGQQDSARIYLEEALALMGKPENDIGLYCAIRDNLAQLDIKAGRLQDALQTFLYNDSAYLVNALYHKYTFNQVRLMEALDMQHEKPDRYFMPLAEFIDKHAARTQPEVVKKFYRFVLQYAIQHHDHELTQEFHTRLIHLQDSLSKQAAVQADALASTLLTVQQSGFAKDLEARQHELETHKLELRNTRIIILAILVIGILIVSLLLMYIRRRKQKHQAMQAIAQAELREKEMQSLLIAQELELKKRDLTNVVLHNTQVYDANQKMIDRLHQINTGKGNAEQQMRTLLADLQQQNQISDRSIGLLQNIETVNASFYENLRTQFPDLTKAESELCGYIRINLSSKDIAILKNVEAASVKMGKNRLRKKLGLSPEEDLYAFVQGI